MRLQLEPNLRISLPGTFDERQEVVIHNGGSDPVVNVAIYPRHFIFGDPNEPPIMSQGRPQETPGGGRNAWWFICRLAPNETQKKSLAKEIAIYSRNLEAMKSHTGAGKEPTCLFLLDVDFQREIDRRDYQITKVAHLLEVQTNGKKHHVLMEPLYQFSSLRQAIELNSTHPFRGDTLARRT